MVEVTNPITGEITDENPLVRYRRRSVFLDSAGREIPDPRPMQPPVGYKKQPSMFELVRDGVQQYLRSQQGAERETFEESEDFDIPDDPIDPSTPWENDFDPPVSELRDALLAAKKQREAEHPPEPAPSPKGQAPGAGGASPGEAQGSLDHPAK